MNTGYVCFCFNNGTFPQLCVWKLHTLVDAKPVFTFSEHTVIEYAHLPCKINSSLNKHVRLQSHDNLFSQSFFYNCKQYQVSTTTKPDNFQYVSTHMKKYIKKKFNMMLFWLIAYKQ